LYQFNSDTQKNTPFFLDVAWIWPKPEKIVMEGDSHSHEFDELVTLFGTNPTTQETLAVRWSSGLRMKNMNSQTVAYFYT
jgi:hypothetical protein